MVGHGSKIWIAKGLDRRAGSNVIQLQSAISAISQEFGSVRWVELNPGNATLVYSGYLGTTVPRSDIPKSETAIHVPGDGRERIARYIDAIGR